MKNSLPVILLRGIVVLPYAELKIDLADNADLKIIDLAEKEYDGYALLVSPSNALEKNIDINSLPNFGVIGKVDKKTNLPNDNVRITIKGIKRTDIGVYEPYKEDENIFTATLKAQTRYAFTSADEEALIRKLKLELDHYIETVSYASNSIISVTDEINSISELADVVANYLPLTFERKYEYLKTVNPHTRVMMDLEDIQKELDIFEIEEKLNGDVKKGLDKAQKEYVLREKLKLIKEELGEASSKDDDVLKMQERLKKLKAPKNIIKKIESEINKYEATPFVSPEISIIRNYIEVLLSLPWNIYTDDNNDLVNAKKVLDASHYGLEEIKERIIEFLAVKQRSLTGKAPIICLVGPPGVGKTTLAKSVATATNRKFVKISVGGVNDPAEITGHRRTYLGANPGRIINALKKCGSNNPVFLIDEIDKMTKDIKGDPASALLEVLDEEQNDKFYDNYVEEAYDLSKVMFILTANYIDQIPLELKDRLEIIELSSYTEYEKLFIAKEHLIPIALENYNLTDKNIKFSDDVINTIIRNYTREAGVRELKRLIDKIMRKCIKEMLEKHNDTINVKLTAKLLEKYLGKQKYESSDMIDDTNYGVVNGLAYTQYGGDVLPLEVVTYPSKDAFKFTGNLGKVMEESIDIAIGHIKSHLNDYDIDEKSFHDMCIHVNAISGAIPKDGPSAGVALTTAIISCLLKKSVSKTYAMTGEMTLTGKVLPIGGLKEKSLGAFKAGIKDVFIPRKNEADLDDVPKEIRSKINYILVDDYKDIYDVIFKKDKLKK